MAEVHYVAGKAKQFELSAIDVPLHDLRLHLRTHPSNMAHIHPTRFEQLMADCPRSAYPGSHVNHLGGPGDRGIDLYLITTPGDTYLVQTKRRSDLSSTEGVQSAS